jgi:putative transferase (TIGR04331 family)
MKRLALTEIRSFWNADAPLLFLWQRAKNALLLEEKHGFECETAPYLLSSRKQIIDAQQFCAMKYFKHIGILASRMNDYHKTSFSENFWKTFYCFWLYRIICASYDKYIALKKYVPEGSVKISTLAPKNYFIPETADESYALLSSAFGVQQLSSIYFDLFHKSKYPEINEKCNPSELQWFGAAQKGTNSNGHIKYSFIIKKYFRQIKSWLTIIAPLIVFGRKNCHIDIISGYFSGYFLIDLMIKSKGIIRKRSFERPEYRSAQANIGARNDLLFLEPDFDDFDKYLFKILLYFMPKTYVEDFAHLHQLYASKDLDRTKIVISDSWLGDEYQSLYIACLREKGAKHFHLQHGWAFMVEPNTMWLEEFIADKYITTGCENTDSEKTIVGGFTRKLPRIGKRTSDDIVFFSTTSTPYLYQIDENICDSLFYEYLEDQKEFISLLAPNVSEQFFYRNYPIDFQWSERQSAIKANPIIKLDDVSVPGIKRIAAARICIFDVFSTGYLESLILRKPTVILANPKFRFIIDRYQQFIQCLADAMIVHYSAKSAALHLNTVFCDLNSWWKSKKTIDAVSCFLSYAAKPKNKTKEYLLQEARKFI